ncbi:MAG: transcriptional regulator [Candidatus Roseilinea sp.]|nr:MAG: transcriptional regulator [Candidatus Roseilinea sp.]
MPETREKVLRAAEQLGYRRTYSRNGHGLSTIGLLVKLDPGVSPMTFNPFFSPIQAGVEQECRLRRLNLMLATVEVDRSNQPLAWPRMIEDQAVDGLLILGTNITGIMEPLLRVWMNKPIVLVDSYAPAYPFDSVLIDNFNGAAVAVRHLFALGHRHIGLIGSNPNSPPDVLERRQAYLQTTRSLGLETYVEDDVMTREAGYESLKRLLQRAPHVTGVFVVNDDTAIGVLNAARDMGLSVPGELSIVGFDDIALASEVQPALTTVHVPKAWLGRLGVRQLIERVCTPELPRVTISVSTHLVRRASSAYCLYSNCSS